MNGHPPWPPWPPPPTEEQRRALLRVLDSGRWGATSGTVTEEFAAAFARRSGAAHGVCTVNGTVALFLALRALGVGPGHEVIVPAYTFVASATAVVLAGAVPVAADVTEDTLHLEPAAVRAVIGPRTRAVMAVHLGGAPADVEALRSLGLPVVEDAAQAHGAARHGRPAGSLGDVACFSFQSGKAMTAGEGGIVVTGDRALYERVWSLHNVGRSPGGGWYDHPVLGWNLRMTEFQAALLGPQLDRLDDWIDRRARAADALAGALDGVPGLDLVPAPPGTTRHTWHLAMLRYDAGAFGGRTKAEFLAAMAAEGVPLEAGYRSLSRVPYVRAAAPCPVAEAAEEGVVWVRQPMLMAGEAAMAYVADAARAVRRRRVTR
ncbi:DegT/DnrJ/EryC1/StrS family aminotransferase [Streptomyces sp. NPDC047821]|uniref:DegT/DnrJ/EryC1/StrS family aminotransferase n=1 Tax=Streptomyces sp. NPDC047821 TaxID=3365488 RepID=UPI0037203329